MHHHRHWNPVEVIPADAQGLVLVVLLALVVLAQWSTNNSANLIPAALTPLEAAAWKRPFPEMSRAGRRDQASRTSGQVHRHR